jgi:hypothetical protein
MRIMRSWVILAGVLMGASHFVAGGQPRYKVTLQAVQPAALAKARTYAWIAGHPSFDKTMHHSIVAAVDRELGARGFTKLSDGQSDVVVTYDSVSRTNVDVKAKAAKDGTRPEFPVGTLVVGLSDPVSRRLLFRVRVANIPIDRDPERLEAAINAVMTAVFDKYPTFHH